MKTCNKCLICKEESLFYSSRKECKDCTKANRKSYYSNNRTKCIKAMQSYESNNQDKIKKQSARYRLANQSQIRNYNQEYYSNNKNTIIEKERIYNNRRYREDPLFKLKTNLRNRLYIALKNNYKSGSAVKDLGCSIEFLKSYLESKFKLNMSWLNYGKWHIDHIKPLNSFDLTDSSQLKIACHYTNLQPLWAKDNLSKGSTLH